MVRLCCREAVSTKSDIHGAYAVAALIAAYFIRLTLLASLHVEIHPGPASSGHYFRAIISARATSPVISSVTSEADWLGLANARQEMPFINEARRQ